MKISGEELDPVVDNVLDKNFIKAGTLLKVKLGDSGGEVTQSVLQPGGIDFIVTMKGLEDEGLLFKLSSIQGCLLDD